MDMNGHGDRRWPVAYINVRIGINRQSGTAGYPFFIVVFLFRRKRHFL